MTPRSLRPFRAAARPAGFGGAAMLLLLAGCVPPGAPAPGAVPQGAEMLGRLEGRDSSLPIFMLGSVI